MDANSPTTGYEQDSAQLADALRGQARRGFAPAELIRNEGLLRFAEELGLSGSSSPELALQLHNELVETVQELEEGVQPATRVLLGVDDSPDRVTLTDRRETAASLLGRSGDSFRKNVEPELFRRVADEMRMRSVFRTAQVNRTGSVSVASGNTPISARRVLLSHGSDQDAADNVKRFLRALGLAPVDWGDGIASTGLASPDVAHALRATTDLVQAIIILLTPDDDGKPSSNVLVEAGLALGIAPDRTLLVATHEVELPAILMDVGVIRLSDSVASRNGVRSRLVSAGCEISVRNESWKVVGHLDRRSERAEPGDAQPDVSAPVARVAWVLECWHAVLETLRTSSPLLAAAVEDASPMADPADRLTLVWPEESAFLKRKAESGRDALTQAMRAVTGISVEVAYELRGSRTPPTTTWTPTVSDEELVKRFMDEFDSEVLPPEPEEDS
ncbi:nucleotide-binding protein [Solirubrobacter phytolaccae]|uniref:Nucleotide-binding protein n=1 Tax=Solirubrobacter phytolaccae TaxID=1404360 RepID=A0A9X3S9C5_9ACTN|nr:TIR domain-containing protein [Solirubrobacter phytolaccae]MDA0183259.1 nucleotide-binding protein [Solirubrobacter phytolaccae]